MTVRNVMMTLVLAAGCQQGLGDRCQVTSDCESPLVCNSATSTCEETSGGGLDASVPDGHILLDGLIDSPGSGSGSGSDTGSGSGSDDGSGSGSGSA